MKLDNLSNNDNMEKNIDNNKPNININIYNPDIMLDNAITDIGNLDINNVTSNVEEYNPDIMIGNNVETEIKTGSLIENKKKGMEREKIVNDELKEKYPESEGYQILSEEYLRDENGNIVKDPETNEARRVDFVVVKDNKVVDMVEVTSLSADKVQQIAKEYRIRSLGGNYIKDNNNNNLVKIPNNVLTRIERRE